MSLLQLRPVRGLEDVEYNFNIVLSQLASFSGDQIEPASIPATAFRDTVIVSNGDAVLSGLSATTVEASTAALGSATVSGGLSVSGALTAGGSLTLAGEAVATEPWTTAAISTALIPYLTSANAVATYRTLADSYNQAQVDAAIAAAEPSVATTTVEGLVLQSEAVADLGLTIGDPPTQAGVQAISDKVDELLAALRAAGLLDS